MLLQTSYTMRLKILRKSAYKLLYYSHLLMIHCNLRHSGLSQCFFKSIQLQKYIFFLQFYFISSTQIVLCVFTYYLFRIWTLNRRIVSGTNAAMSPLKLFLYHIYIRSKRKWDNTSSDNNFGVMSLMPDNFFMAKVYIFIRCCYGIWYTMRNGIFSNQSTH